MADDLKRVGLIFKADGTVDFKKSLQEVNASIEENKAAFELAKSTWDDSTKSAEKLQDRQKYLAKQTKDYADKVKMLKGELRELEESEKRNSEKIQVKRERLEATKNTAEKYKKKCNELKTELQNLENEENANTEAIERKRVEVAKAEKGFADYSAKVEKLEKDLDNLNKSEANHEANLKKKKAQIERAEASLNQYKRGLKAVEQELEDGANKTKQYTKRIEEFGEKAEKAGDKMSGISTAAAGVLAGVTALVPATEEYRKIMGSFEVSSEAAGYTAEQTEETYKSLFGVLGDDQSAATTTANLQALGLSQEQLNQIVNGTIGAWAKYGDSIPIDGLAEAINETAKVGTVTGTFADVLNWAGTSEDAFNEKLAACSTESERANLIMQELANQGLMEMGEKWKENNKNLVEGNEATAEFQEETAELADTVAPLITELTELAAGLLGKFNDLPTSVQAVIGIAIALTAASSTLFTAIGKVSTGISGLTNFMGMASKGASALWGIISANPIGATVTLVLSLIAVFTTLYEKCEWFRDGVNKIWGDIKAFLKGMVSFLREVFNFKWQLPKIELPHFSISGKFSLNPPSIPKFSVSWFAGGGILTRPTAFDVNGDDVKVGGEREPEAILPISLLKRYIREENSMNNVALADIIKEAIAELHVTAENNIYIGDKKLVSVLTEMVIKELSQKMYDTGLAKGMT